MIFGYVSALLLVCLVVTDYTPFNVVEGKNILPYNHFISFTLQLKYTQLLHSFLIPHCIGRKINHYEKAYGHISTPDKMEDNEDNISQGQSKDGIIHSRSKKTLRRYIVNRKLLKLLSIVMFANKDRTSNVEKELKYKPKMQPLNPFKGRKPEMTENFGIYGSTIGEPQRKGERGYGNDYFLRFLIG